MEPISNPKYNILAADDDPALLNLLSNELTSEGYKVTLANNGAEAITCMKKNKFDLVILDIKMPKVDGLEVLKFIKINFSSTKVIMLTAYADLTNALESKRLGADGFLDKPCDLFELLTTMNRVLSN